MTAKELVSKCLDTAKNYKTLYVMGCFGAPMTVGNKARYTKNHPFNARPERSAKILAAAEDTFGFDCVCFIKALLWGWSGDKSQVYGGAVYKSNGVPDIDTERMLSYCTDVSGDFGTIVPGELVYQPGHVGIYVGGGMAVECTEAEADGVQLQAVLPMGAVDGMPCTAWTKHGKLPWIDYSEAGQAVTEALYRVTVEGLPKAKAENLAKSFTDTGYTVHIEQMAQEDIQEEKPAEPVPEPVPAPVPEPEQPWEPAVGDTVYFGGGMQYGNANAEEGSERPAGQAKITKTAPGKKHPYHLVKTGSVGPYGWVDAGTFTKA